MNYKYVAYISDGMIIESNNYHYIFDAVRRTVRDMGYGAGIISYKESNRPIAVFTRLNECDNIYYTREDMITREIIIGSFFERDEYSSWAWEQSEFSLWLCCEF